jgi:hypothetical protein
MGGRAGRPKNYRHKKIGRTKKVVTGQSQNAIFSCFKSILAYPRFGHVMEMLRIVAYQATVSASNDRAIGGGYKHPMNGRHWWLWYSTIIIFLILNRIFLAEKCLLQCFPGFQPRTL